MAALQLCYRCSCKFCDSKIYIVIIQVLSPCTPAALAGLRLALRQDSDSGAGDATACHGGNPDNLNQWHWQTQTRARARAL